MSEAAIPVTEAVREAPRRPQVATVWLDGCSGCHMSFLDMDERLVEVFRSDAGGADLVYSPLVDRKDFPEDVDVTLVEGAVSSEEDLHKIRLVRSRTRILVAMGDCAVTTNVPGMRNPFGAEAVLHRAYVENAEPSLAGPERQPSLVVPRLLPRVLPVHEVVKVDVFLPGCPPSADTLHAAVVDLLAGRTPDVLALTRFGR